MSATPAPRPHGSTPCPPKTTSRPPCGHDRRADPPRPRPAHLSGEQRGLDRPPARGVPLDAVQARARTVGRPDRDPGAVATDGGLLVLLSNLQESGPDLPAAPFRLTWFRSEERRVGQEWRQSCEWTV